VEDWEGAELEEEEESEDDVLVRVERATPFFLAPTINLGGEKNEFAISQTAQALNWRED